MRNLPTPLDLRQMAAHYQDLSRMVNDELALKALQELARNYERAAVDIEQGAVRRRAHEIWLEEGRPTGRHLDHWQRAEEEVLKCFA